MKWCCVGLKTMFEQRYERNIFVFAEPPSFDDQFHSFWIAMRCVDYKNLDQMSKVKLPIDVPVTISTRFPISFCPWCGKKLQKFYKRDYGILIDDKLIKEFSLLCE